MNTRIFKLGLLMLGLGIGLGQAACGDDDPSPETIEVAGRWASNFGGFETITSTSWGGFEIIEFDNLTNFAVTQNPADAAFFPSKYNKYVWTEPAGGAFFYCTVDFGLDTADQARTSTQTADASDPSTTGCGSFPWTQLSQP